VRRRVIWVNQEKQGVSIPFPVISMHAVSRDPALSEKPCIYCQLDQPEQLAAHDGDEPLDVYEMKFIPFLSEQGAISPRTDPDRTLNRTTQAPTLCLSTTA
jgi:hypothetical protein